jgi:hypothetical protein
MHATFCSARSGGRLTAAAREGRGDRRRPQIPGRRQQKRDKDERGTTKAVQRLVHLDHILESCRRNNYSSHRTVYRTDAQLQRASSHTCTSHSPVPPSTSGMKRTERLSCKRSSCNFNRYRRRGEGRGEMKARSKSKYFASKER